MSLNGKKDSYELDTTDLPPLPKGWCWTRVGDVGDVKLGRQRSPEHHNGPHMRPYLRVANVYEDRIDLSDVMKMNFTPEEYETYCLQHGDILLNEGQSLEWVGRPAMYRDEVPGACFQNTLVRFRAKPGVDPAYALYLFRHYLHAQRFQRIAKWTVNIAHLGAQRFADIEFPLAPTNEQHRIVAKIDELFSHLDAGVAALERVKANLKRYRTAVLKAAVEGRLTEEWRKENHPKETGQQLLDCILRQRRRKWEEDQLAAFAKAGKIPPPKWKDKYKEPASVEATDLPALPEGWCWARVEQLLIEPSCNGISIKGTDSPPGVPALRLSAMGSSGFDYTDRRYIPISDEMAEDLAIKAGDFFVARGNGSLHLVGRGTLAQHPDERIVFPDTMIRLRLAAVPDLPKFLGLIWPSRLARRQIEGKARTTAGIYKISQRDIDCFVVPIPPLCEQGEIMAEAERRLSIIAGAEAEIEANLKRARSLRHVILKRAFEGRLILQDPNDEPALVLLDHLRADRVRGCPNSGASARAGTHGRPMRRAGKG